MNEQMKQICDDMMSHEGMGHQLAKGAAVMSVGYVAGRSVLGRLFGFPLVMFAAGVAAGYYGYKYRKEIVAAMTKAGESGKDWALNAKESLADLVEEAREAEETKGRKPKAKE
jgi:hypothetical protein